MIPSSYTHGTCGFSGPEIIPPGGLTPQQALARSRQQALEAAVPQHYHTHQRLQTPPHFDQNDFVDPYSFPLDHYAVVPQHHHLHQRVQTPPYFDQNGFVDSQSLSLDHYVEEDRRNLSSSAAGPTSSQPGLPIYDLSKEGPPLWSLTERFSQPPINPSFEYGNAIGAPTPSHSYWSSEQDSTVAVPQWDENAYQDPYAYYTSPTDDDLSIDFGTEGLQPPAWNIYTYLAAFEAVGLVDFEIPRVHRQHIWFDVRNIIPWEDFTMETIMSYPVLMSALMTPVTNSAPTVALPNASGEVRFWQEASRLLVRVNRALPYVQGEDHATMMIQDRRPMGYLQEHGDAHTKTRTLTELQPIQVLRLESDNRVLPDPDRIVKNELRQCFHPDFTSNFKNDTKTTIQKRIRSRLVGVLKCSSHWNSSLQDGNAVAMLKLRA